MKPVRMAVSGLAGLMMGAGVATTAVAQPAPGAASAWNGLYVGQFTSYSVSSAAFELGVHAGYNFVSGRLVAGVEARIGSYLNPTIFSGWIGARAGILLGDRAIIYNVVSLGAFGGVPVVYADFGVGAEIALTPRASLFGEVKGVGALGAGCCYAVLRAGVNWRP